MRSRRAAFLAVTLDGFIARPDGGIDWLERIQERIPPGEDRGYAAFIATVDGLVLGRGTFEKVLSFGFWPYADLRVYVLSRTLLELPPGLPETVSLHASTPEEIVDLAASEGRSNLYIDGGATIRSFLRAGLLDEITITTVPVLIGSGRPLFGDPDLGDVPLDLMSCESFPDGLVQCRYAIRRED